MRFEWIINGFGLGAWWFEDEGGQENLCLAIGPFMVFVWWEDGDGA